MAVGGIGGLIGQAWFPGLDDRMAQHITPNPSPLAQQGGPAAPGSVDSLGNPSRSGPPSGSNLPPAAATQPDPANAVNVARLADPSYARDAQAMVRRDAMAQGVNQGLDSIAAGFGTAQQQASKQAAIRSGGAGDSLGDLMNIQKMQDQTIADNEHARFMANAAVFAQTLRNQGINVTDAQAMELMNNKNTLADTSSALGSAMTPTGTSKDFKAAQAATETQIKLEHPDWTPAQIQKEVNARVPPSMMMQGLGSLSDQEYRQYAAAEQAAGRAPLGPVEWSEQQKNKAITQETETKDAQEHKDSAQEGYTLANEKMTNTSNMIDRLSKNIDNTMWALKMPDDVVSGKKASWLDTLTGGYLSPSEETRGLAADIRTLKASLTSSALTDVKNVRNRVEFESIGNSLTAGLDAANSPTEVARVLAEAKHKVAALQADIKASAGKPLTQAEASLANSQYITKVKKDGSPNPYYGGSTIIEDSKDSSGPASNSGGGPAPIVKRRHYNEKGELVD